MVDSAELFNLMVLNTLGLSILTQTLQTAAKFIYLKSTSPRSEKAECYAFVQGTGLDTFLMCYGLEYDPEGLREGFNFYLKRKENGHHKRDSLPS